MRRAIVVAAVLGLVTVAVTAVAVPPPSFTPTVPTVVPTARVPVPGATIRVVSFLNRTQAKPAPGPAQPSPWFYKSGPVIVNVELENTGTTPRSVIVQLTHGSTTMTQTVVVRPKGSQPTDPNTNIQFADPGIEESCGPHTYAIKLEGEGTDPRVRHAAITPSCLWTSQVQDAWVAIPPPDLSWTEFVSTVEVVSAPSCTTTASMKATVVNKNTKVGTPVTVTGSNGNTVKMQSAPFPLPAQQQSTVVAFGGESSGGVAPVDLAIALGDPTHTLTGTLYPHSLMVRFNRACMLNNGVLTD